MNKEGYSALIFGSTGATGSELVKILINSSKWSKIHVVVRRQLPEWKQEREYSKLVVQQFQDIDLYFKQPNDKYAHVDIIFCCLGSQTKHGEDVFVKIDKTYPLLAGDIAKKNNIPQYALVSSTGSNQNSCFLYPRIKGECERDLKSKKINLLSIFKPGLLLNRKEARCGEKFFSCCCCFPQIEARSASEAFVIVAEGNISLARKSEGKVDVYDNSDMLRIVEEGHL